MATQPSSYITPEEYLAIERHAETRSEYFQGEMFAMSGTTRAHTLIVTNLVGGLWSRFRNSGCEVYSNEMRVLVSATGLYTYPDVIVVCGEPALLDQHFDTLKNPTLIIEVLSPSTRDYDLGGKFHQYMRISSLQEYVTVSQSEMAMSQAVRQSDGSWLIREIQKEAGKIKLASLEVQLDFADIYEKVSFPAA